MKINLPVSFTKSPDEAIGSLSFSQMPVAGDGVETEKCAYIVRRIIHHTDEGIDVTPYVSVLLEPVDSVV